MVANIAFQSLSARSACTTVTSSIACCDRRRSIARATGCSELPAPADPKSATTGAGPTSRRSRIAASMSARPFAAADAWVREFSL